ncbi:hypothetical protein OIV83_006151 [Microbotryomycetes sp. JL201]|nr:hypothetical protein OIV83_006151 [Microbotryomycetes sp. JL201]
METYPMPDRVIYITSRDGHKLKAHLYEPATARTALAVVINLHGSGYVLRLHGESDEFCRKLRDEAQVSVYDVTYRLAPEYPFPAAYNDAEDVLEHVVKAHPNVPIVVSGFSAGGTLALCVSSNGPLELRDKSYLSLSGQVERVTEDGADQVLLVKKDPRFSYSTNEQQLEAMPDTVVVLTAGLDLIAPEAEAFADKLRQTRTRASVGGGGGGAAGAAARTVVVKRFTGVQHAFDIQLSSDRDVEAKDEAYGMAVGVVKGLVQ